MTRMAKEIEPYNLPVGPSDLCFDTNEFAKASFSVDKFLQNHSRKANLEAMRDDLGIYLKVLRAAMIELINKDYADFVNLSTNLIGLDKAISGIQVPLGQLKEEVLQVKVSLDEAISDISARLNERQELRSKKRSLQNLARVQGSLRKLSDLLQIKDSDTESQAKLVTDPVLVERAASEYNQLQFCISKCSSYLTTSHTTLAEKICDLLTSSLDEMFLNSARTADASGMSRCLRIYVILDKISEVEALFRKEIVAPAMSSIINEASLQSDPMGLRGVYARVLDFMQSHMKELLDLTTDNKTTQPGIKGFDFLVNSFWPEVEQRLELHLSSIYAPGNPEVFYQRYSETVEFLVRLERCCGTQTRVKVLQAHPQYSAFRQRWNLPVYFQIRFQEIAGSLEVAATEKSLEMLRPAGAAGFRLQVTVTVWECLERCWKDGIFLGQLAHRFWKLSLQIVARYYVWVGAALKEKWPSEKVQSSTTPNTGTPGTTTPTVDTASSKDEKLSFLVSLYVDIETFASKLPAFLDAALSKMAALSSRNRVLVAESLHESRQQLLSRLPSVAQFVLGEVSARSLAQLRQVGDIPRLFRRTNREVPTKPCGYVALLLGPPAAFHDAYRTTVDPAVLRRWLTLVFSAVTAQYYSSVDDVLVSVQKTEESLRRLKKIRDRATTATAANENRGVGDDDKIRMQLAIDVLCFCDGVGSIGIERKDVEKLDELVALVEAARDSRNITSK